MKGELNLVQKGSLAVCFYIQRGCHCPSLRHRVPMRLARARMSGWAAKAHSGTVSPLRPLRPFASNPLPGRPSWELSRMGWLNVEGGVECFVRPNCRNVRYYAQGPDGLSPWPPVSPSA